MNGAVRVWHEGDGTHIDVRGLPAPQPRVQILQQVRGRGAGTALVVHHPPAPQLLYPELAQIGWGAERIAGEPGEWRLRLAPLA